MAATSAFACTTVTLIWPDYAVNGHKYMAQLVDENDSHLGIYTITITDDRTDILDASPAAAVCFWHGSFARHLNSMTLTLEESVVVFAPLLDTGKICVATRANENITLRPGI